MNTIPLYELSVENYEKLLETNQGELIYGKDFPKNAAIFRSMQAKYLAVNQLFYVVNNMVERSGASAKDLITFINEYGEAIADINTDIFNGLITDQDMEDMIRYIDNTEDEV